MLIVLARLHASLVAAPPYKTPAVPAVSWAALVALLVAVFLIKTLVRIVLLVALVVLAVVAWKQGWLGPGFLNGLKDDVNKAVH